MNKDIIAELGEVLSNSTMSVEKRNLILNTLKIGQEINLTPTQPEDLVTI